MSINSSIETSMNHYLSMPCASIEPSFILTLLSSGGGTRTQQPSEPVRPTTSGQGWSLFGGPTWGQGWNLVGPQQRGFRESWQGATGETTWSRFYRTQIRDPSSIVSSGALYILEHLWNVLHINKPLWLTPCPNLKFQVELKPMLSHPLSFGSDGWLSRCLVLSVNP